jgi:hypothetical protein
MDALAHREAGSEDPLKVPSHVDVREPSVKVNLGDHLANVTSFTGSSSEIINR